jgi:hypothetical protein
VIIPAGVTLDITGKTLVLPDESLVVYGTLTGTSGVIDLAVTDDRTFLGNDPAHPELDFKPDTDFGVWIMPGGACLLRDPAPRTAWVYAQSIGSGVALLNSSPAGWQVGDEVLLVAPNGLRTVTTITSMGLASASIRNTSFSAAPVLGPGGRVRYPVVANLTRNIVIRSSLVAAGDYSHRAHFIAVGDHMTGVHPHVHLTGVALTDLGTRGKLGRYQWHGHHAGHAAHGDSLLRNVFRSSFPDDPAGVGSHAIVFHETDGYLTQENIVLGCQGHVLMMELGTETAHVIDGNLIVGGRSGEETAVPDQKATLGTNGLWVRGDNITRNNLVIGDQAAANVDMGYGWLPSKIPGALNVVSSQNDQAWVTEQYAAWSSIDGAVFDNLTALYCRTSGFWANGTGQQKMRLRNCDLWFNGEPGVNYRSQVYVQQAQVTVEGGSWTGGRGLHVHYDSQADILGVEIAVDDLCDLSYWEMVARFSGCKVHVKNLFSNTTYALRRQAPGSLTLQGNSGLADGVYVGPFHRVPAPHVLVNVVRSGVVVARQLKTPIPLTGFVRLRLGQDTKTTWRVTLSGQVPSGNFVAVRENEADWNSSSPGWLEGLLPGAYHIESKRGTAAGVSDVQVLSGVAVDA